MNARLGALLIVAAVLIAGVWWFGPPGEESVPPPTASMRAVADIRGLAVALHLFKRDCTFFPTTEQGLGVLVAGHGGESLCASYDPQGYFPAIPLDPWGHPYIFVSDGRTFVIRSNGADGKPGGEGLAADLDSLSDAWLRSWSSPEERAATENTPGPFVDSRGDRENQ